MYRIKQKFLTLSFIFILLLSLIEFTAISIKVDPLNSCNFCAVSNNELNYEINNFDNNILNDYQKITTNLANIIEDQPNLSININIYLKDDFLINNIDTINNKYDELSLEKARSYIYSEQSEHNLPLLNQIIAAVEALDGIILSTSIILNALSVEIQADKIPLLAQIPEVIRIEKEYSIYKYLFNSVPTLTSYTGSNPAFQWDYSTYNGSGITVAVVDTGIYKLHTALLGKVVQEKDFTGGSDPGDLDGHGTHVAGIIASNDLLYKGIAPGVDLINVKSLTSGGVGNSFWVIAGVEWALIDNDFNVSIVSMSAGAAVEADGVNGFVCFVDYIVKYYRVLWVNAAGNAGPSSSSIEVPGDTYNGIAVGNVNDMGNIDRSDDSIVSSSSRGPTDGIPRIKPDICAPGQNIMSCSRFGGFVPNSGTSMATPHVSGAAALLWEYYRKNPLPGISESYFPMLIKGIILHTAEDKGTPGPDNNYGYGYIDMVKANQFSSYGNALIDNFINFGSSINKYKFIITENTEFNISLLWYKQATYDIINHQYTGWQSNAVTNLDLYIENDYFQVIASSANLYDNFEQIAINCTPGTYYVRIEVNGRALYASPETYMILSSAPLEKIFWLDAWSILFIVLIVGSIACLVILVAYYIKTKDGKKESSESDYLEPNYDDYFINSNRSSIF